MIGSLVEYLSNYVEQTNVTTDVAAMKVESRIHSIYTPCVELLAHVFCYGIIDAANLTELDITSDVVRSVTVAFTNK